MKNPAAPAARDRKASGGRAGPPPAAFWCPHHSSAMRVASARVAPMNTLSMTVSLLRSQHPINGCTANVQPLRDLSGTQPLLIALDGDWSIRGPARLHLRGRGWLLGSETSATCKLRHGVETEVGTCDLLCVVSRAPAIGAALEQRQASADRPMPRAIVALQLKCSI